MEDRLVEQVGDVRIVERVNHAPAVAHADNKSEVAQHTQLVRNGGSLHLNGFGELVHGAGSLTEPRQNPDTARGRERLHRLRDLPGGFRIDNGRSCVPLYPVAHRAMIAE